jgi:hypothetical protein
MPTNLILTLVGLLFLLIALVFVYVWLGHTRTKAPAVPETVETFESLREIINSRASSNAQLNRAVTLIIERFAHIDPRHIAAYQHLLQTLCVHPHTDSKLILRFERAMREANPSRSHDIEQALAIGLAARGQRV